ncbi:MAG: Uncharacterised protein [Opitutia bacterium UBA7350]|nr:MAG: Uncharacterised protein [Opitutae bacterium UBA7350]
MTDYAFTAKLPPRLPRLAIDLGYSATQASCGIATQKNKTHTLHFGACIEWTAEYLHSNGPHILILEAVLSTYHKADGNPHIRGTFEKGRGWYHGPGVSTYAAAFRFLQALAPQLPNFGPLPLVEGFLSYKPTKTSHAHDAERLIKEFECAERFTPCPGSEPICPLIDNIPEIRRYNKPTT